MTDLSFLLSKVLLIAQTAGQIVHSIYQHAPALDINYKDDNSPVTEADLRSHEILVSGLQQLTFFGKTLPVLSEEGKHLPFEVRQTWPAYWLIDPLDGTKEFINKTDEFAINIALVHEHHPILGVVYHPCKRIAYYGANRLGAFMKAFDTPPVPIRATQTLPSPVRIALSRHHTDSMEKQHATAMDATIVYCGSALKICLVAAGEADIYPRLGPTSEWDTAAGHCILNEAGGGLTDLYGQPLRYNTKESLKNPSFIAVGNTQEAWVQKLDLLRK